MRTWLANKLFHAAYRIDREETVVNSRLVVILDDVIQGMMSVKRKPGRPKGTKDGVGPKPAPKKRGRPLGSKNKPKDPVA